MLGLGRDQVARPDRYSLTPVASGRTRSGLGAANVEVHGRGRIPGRELPPVHISGEISGLGEQRRWNEIDHPAADADAVRKALGLGRRGRLARIARQSLLVNVADMREVEQ